MSISQEMRVLACYILGGMRELWKDSTRPCMPNINIESWLQHLIKDAYLVAHYSFNQRLWIIQMAGTLLGLKPDTFFQEKTYKRTLESVAKARRTVELHGKGWFYFGMTHFYSWKDMIELINESLMLKSTELVWLEKMGPQLLAPCPKCKIMISYTSCIVKLEDFDHRITCRTCADHDR